MTKDSDPPANEADDLDERERARRTILARRPTTTPTVCLEFAPPQDEDG